MGALKMQDLKITNKKQRSGNARLEKDGPRVASHTNMNKDAYLHDERVADVVRCLLSLPLLPAHDIVGTRQDIRITIATNGSYSSDAASATGGVHQSLNRYHAGLRRRIQVSHQNLFNFLTHIEYATVNNTCIFSRPQHICLSLHIDASM